MKEDIGSKRSREGEGKGRCKKIKEIRKLEFGRKRWMTQMGKVDGRRRRLEMEEDEVEM